jgi:hypothetical protein
MSKTYVSFHDFITEAYHGVSAVDGLVLREEGDDYIVQFKVKGNKEDLYITKPVPKSKVLDEWTEDGPSWHPNSKGEQ